MSLLTSSTDCLDATKNHFEKHIGSLGNKSQHVELTEINETNADAHCRKIN